MAVAGRFLRLRSTPVVSAVAASALILAVAGCTDPDQGTIENPTTNEATATPDGEPMFVADLDSLTCPGSEVIPAPYKAPPEFVYAESDVTPMQGAISKGCAYVIEERDVEHTAEELDGLQVIRGIEIGFVVTDGDESSAPITADALTPQIDFKAVPAADFLQDWDSASYETELGHDFILYTESTYTSLSVFAVVDNLYLQARVDMLVVEDDFDSTTAAFEAVEAVFNPMFEQLERE
jgi:hypothetical protein